MIRWLLRMSRWARNPPSPRMALMIVGILIVSLGVAGAERMGWWPDWAVAKKMRHGLRIGQP